jgi:hypothetical protein
MKPPDAKAEDVTVTTIDDVAVDGHTKIRPRKLSEYKPSNTALSKDEIDQDAARDTEHEGWAPRTTENIGDKVPLPEKSSPASEE